MTASITIDLTEQAAYVAQQAQTLLNALGASLRKMDNAGSVAIITEDQIPGGIEGNLDAIEALRADGYDIGIPLGQRDLSKDFSDCRGRTIQLLGTSDGRLLKNG